MTPLRLLLKDILGEVFAHFKHYGEPLALVALQRRFNKRYNKLRLQNGYAMGFSQYIESTAEQGAFTVLRTYGGKRYVAWTDMWTHLTELDRALWIKRFGIPLTKSSEEPSSILKAPEPTTAL